MPLPMKSRGNIFVISAPSGAGKTTICRKLLRSMDNLEHSVSFTTRRPRKGEVDGRDYVFVTKRKFKKMRDQGQFVEWAEVHGNLYGTSRKTLEDLLDSGLDVLLDIDTQGAKQIKKVYRGGVFVFILPPSMTVLRQRLENRMSDTKEDVERRLRRAVDEIRDFKSYNYVIVNDTVEDSVGKLEAIVTAERLRSGRFRSVWIRDHILR